MTGTKRSAADWVWTFIGVAGLACILGSLALFILGATRDGSGGTLEQARSLRRSARVKLGADDVPGALRDLAEAEALSEEYPDEFDRAWRQGLQADILRVQVQHRLNSGNARMKAGETAAAIRDFEAAVTHLTDLGELLWKGGKKEGAVRFWLQAVMLQPVNARPYLSIARWREEEGNDRAALANYRAAFAFHPEPVPEDIEARIGALHAKLRGTLDKETGVLREKFHANPADWMAFNHLLWRTLWTTRCEADGGPEDGLRAALLTIGREFEDLAELVARQESAVRDRPASVVDRAGLGTVLLLSGDFARAKEVFGEALEISDTDRMSLLGAALADLLAGGGEGDRIRRAAERFGTNQIAWIAWGAHRISLSKWDEARPALVTALRFGADMPETFRLLAKVYGAAGETKNREAALEAYRRLF